MLDRVRRRVWGISGRLIVSYVLVTAVVVVLVEVFVLSFELPGLLGDTKLLAQVDSTAASYWTQLSQRYPRGVPVGTLLGERGRRVEPGIVQTTGTGSVLVVPAVRGAISSHKVVTAVVAIARDGRIIASSAPARYPPGQPSTKGLPAAAASAIKAGLLKGVTGGGGSTRFGGVTWTLFARAYLPTLSATGLAYLYVQAPQSTGFVNPLHAWDELRHIRGAHALLVASYVLLIAIVPVGVLFGLLASSRLVRRVRRLELATIAVADGDYTVTLPSHGRDEVARLEANFTTMTRQLNSALGAERERATSEARAAERSRIAREIHDAISQHLFGLRMIASGMRRADPQNVQAQAIEHITEEALRDMQALLWELRPTGLDGGGLAPALQQTFDAYRDRLGVTVDADLADIALPEAVEHTLLRVTQEACTNAIRHGNARRIAVSMTHQNGHVELAIRDDGTGFDPAASHAGSGLQHLRDRVTEVDGTVDIDSALGAGTAVIVRVPVK